jgi:heat shock protein HtpX
MIEEVSALIDMPMPRVYVMDTPHPDAFATGRSPKHAAVAVTTGIRQMLTDRELRDVLGHEMAHVKNRDILTSSVVATIASAISMIAFDSFFFGRRRGIGALVAALVAPFAASVIAAAISRSREFQADVDGARAVGDPEALASALAKIEAGVQRIPREVPQATAHLYIASPLGGINGRQLLSTHLPTEERIRRLRGTDC